MNHLVINISTPTTTGRPTCEPANPAGCHDFPLIFDVDDSGWLVKEFMVDGSDSGAVVNAWWRSGAGAGDSKRANPQLTNTGSAHTWSCQFSPILEISSTKMSGIMCWIRIIYYSKLLRSKMVRALRSITCFAHQRSMSMIQRVVLKPWRVTATILRRGCVTGYQPSRLRKYAHNHAFYLSWRRFQGLLERLDWSQADGLEVCC